MVPAVSAVLAIHKLWQDIQAKAQTNSARPLGNEAAVNEVGVLHTDEVHFPPMDVHSRLQRLTLE